MPIIDAHAHIYPEKIATKAVNAVGRFYGVEASMAGKGSPDDLLTHRETAGITHFIVHSVATTAHSVPTINSFIADQCAQHPEFIGFGTMHPEFEDMEAEVDRAISIGLHGFKLHPDTQEVNMDDPRLMNFYEIIAGRVPLVVHTGDYRYDYSNPNRIVPVLKAFPRLKFIGAHFGGWSIWEEAAAVLSDFPNICVDTSSSFCGLTPERAKNLVRLYGSERVMFGTDYPLWPQKDELAFLERMELLPEELENVCWKTCAELFGISFPEDGQKTVQA